MKFRQITNYEINIKHTANGALILRVGCAEFAYSSPKEMLLNLAEFYADPKKLEKEYNEFMKQHSMVEEAPMPDRGYGNVLSSPTVEAREPVATEESLPDDAPEEKLPDDEEAPRLATNRFNLAPEDGEADADEVSEEEIVELELGDLEQMLEEEGLNAEELPEIEFDFEDGPEEEKKQ